MKYVYSFVVWPSETWGHEALVFEVFRVVGRVEMVITEKGFEVMRSHAGHSGLTFREIERVAYQEPEVVS